MWSIFASVQSARDWRRSRVRIVHLGLSYFLPLGLRAGVTEDAGLARALAGAAFVALPTAFVDHYFDAQSLVGTVGRAVVAGGAGLSYLRGFNLVVAGSAFDPEIVEVLGVGKVELGSLVLVVAGLALDLEHVEVCLVRENDLADG
jgi:hypothetical protein